ncbi:ATP-binding protein [Cohnella hongkongensis]|uniref:histidine kinase n=1 Tax=Cohnella hongkongensis TaxID=178337 RepID=A0ABV9FAF2_9BACL
MMSTNSSKLLKTAAAVGLFLSFLIGLRWLWSEIFQTPPHPAAVQGTLDLRGWNFDNRHTFPLEGEWSFYPGALVDLANEAEQPETARRYIQVPGNWIDDLPEGSKYAYGFGTYRLRILIDPDPALDLGFWIQEISTSSRVEINGSVESEFGQVASSKEAYIPDSRTYTIAYKTVGSGEIQLFVQAANFDRPFTGGMFKPIRFGSLAAVDKERWYSIGFQLVTFVVLLIHSLYACMLFLFNRKEKALLTFALLMFAAGITVVSAHDMLMQQWLPLNYTWAFKIRLLSYTWLSTLILMMGRAFAGRTEKSAAYRIYLAALAAFTLFVLVADASPIYFAYKARVFTFFYLTPLLGFVVLIGRMAIERKNDVVYLFMAIVAVISSVVWGIVNTSFIYYPIDVLAAIISFSAYWFKRYFRNTEENARLNERLKEADRLKDQFLANTSHELRTPLHGILNIARTVVEREKPSLNERSVADMDLLITVGRRMSHLLDDLLDVVRLQEQRVALRKAPVSVASIASGVASMLRFLTEGKPVRIETEISDQLPPAMADEKRLVQILFNLLHNALKFTNEGTVTLSAETQGGQIVIRVSDTGIGMDEETRQRVFLPYEQGGAGMNEDGGIGLGLSICKQLVELHGSELTVTSEPGKGSVFRFALPIAGPSEQTGPQEAPADYEEAAAALLVAASDNERSFSAAEALTAFDAGKANILAVDDDPVNLKVLTGILSSEPYHVTTATSAREALELLASNSWDLVVADVMMPHMSGYELTQKIRESFSMSELPVLLLTARSGPADVQTGFLSGANDYVVKPVDATVLKYRIGALTALKQSVSERLRLEAAYLQAQIHPHFLFNALNSIMALSDEDTTRMRKLGDAFTSYLRISFDFLNSGKLVALYHELELVRAYLYIEKERFEEKLNIVWEIEPDLHVMIPPLTIQPLVENAVRHGVRSRIQGGTVRIRIVRRDGFVSFEVSDDGIGMNEDKAARLLAWENRGRGIGLSNTNRRLTRLYGQGLTVRSRPGEGTTVSFLVPDRS